MSSVSVTEIKQETKPDRKIFIAPWLRMRDYGSDQEFVDEASKHGDVLYETREGVHVRIPASMLDLIEFAIPSDIKTLVTGFGAQPIETRLKTLERFIALGGNINGDNGAMLLAARKGPARIFAFLLEHGASIYHKGTLLLDSNGGSVLNSATCTDNRKILIEHIHANAQRYPNLFNHWMESNTNRFQRFILLNELSDAGIAALVYIISQCFAVSREKALQFKPVNVTVQALLLIDHGIVYADSGTCALAVHEIHTARNAPRLARLAQIDNILHSLHDDAPAPTGSS